MLFVLPAANRAACLRLLNTEGGRFRQSYGAVANHQVWPGGYYDHIREVMNLACLLYGPMHAAMQLPFSLADALLVLFLHDIEKPWKYERLAEGTLEIVSGLKRKDAQHAFQLAKINEYGIVLTPEQANALHYVEGEGADYNPRQRVMNELAAFCHACDTMVARIRYNNPLPADDPWIGAVRTTTTTT